MLCYFTFACAQVLGFEVLRILGFEEKAIHLILYVISPYNLKTLRPYNLSYVILQCL